MRAPPPEPGRPPPSCGSKPAETPNTCCGGAVEEAYGERACLPREPALRRVGDGSPGGRIGGRGSRALLKLLSSPKPIASLSAAAFFRVDMRKLGESCRPLPPDFIEGDRGVSITSIWLPSSSGSGFSCLGIGGGSFRLRNRVSDGMMLRVRRGIMPEIDFLLLPSSMRLSTIISRLSILLGSSSRPGARSLLLERFTSQTEVWAPVASSGLVDSDAARCGGSRVES